MPNVYVEREPKGHPEGSAIAHYFLEFAHGARVTESRYANRQAAVDTVRKPGHKPLIACVRNTSKGNPDHWHEA
jgi:hypothetical protein